MLFEDAGSLGSAVSGQQSPEPEQSKSSLEDGGIGGGGGGSSGGGGGVLTGGNVPVKPLRKEGASKKLFLLDRASVFAIPRGIRSSPTTTTVGSHGNNQGGLGGSSRCGVTVSSIISTTTNTTSTITTVTTSTTMTSTPTQDHKASPEYKTTASVYSGTTRGSTNSTTSSNNKPSRRTASLLNLFVASTSFAGMWLMCVNLLFTLWQHVARFSGLRCFLY